MMTKAWGLQLARFGVWGEGRGAPLPGDFWRPARGLLILLWACASWLPAQVTVVILRHAEKVGHSTNSGLTINGCRRAEALVAELAPLQPVALFASEHLRTQLTIQPLAHKLGLPIQARPRWRTQAMAAEILRDFPQGTVVVCGHHDTVGALAHALGYKGSLDDVYDFDLYWILRIGPEGFLSFEERRQKPLTR